MLDAPNNHVTALPQLRSTSDGFLRCFCYFRHFPGRIQSYEGRCLSCAPISTSSTWIRRMEELMLSRRGYAMNNKSTFTREGPAGFHQLRQKALREEPGHSSDSPAIPLHPASQMFLLETFLPKPWWRLPNHTETSPGNPAGKRAA
jgi:hypothetical protein